MEKYQYVAILFLLSEKIVVLLQRKSQYNDIMAFYMSVKVGCSNIILYVL